MRQERILLFTLACVQFSHIVDFMIMMPLVDILMADLSINPQQFSFLVASYTLSAGVSTLVAALYLDKLNRKTVVLVSFIGFLLGTVACGLANTYPIFLAARIFTGAFGGIVGSIIYAIIGDVIPLERRGRAMGVIMAAFSLASVVGVPVGYTLAYKFNWHLPFLMIGVFGLIILALIYKYVPSLSGHINKNDTSRKIEVMTNVIKNPNQLRALLFMFLMMMGHFTIIPFITKYFINNVHLEEFHITLVYMIGGGLTIITAPIIGRLADRYGRALVFSFCAGLAIVPILAITNMGIVPPYVALSFTGMFFVFVSGRMVPAQTMLTAAAKTQNRGSFMSIVTAIREFASSLASIISGIIVIEAADGRLVHYDKVGYLAAVCSVLAIIVAWRVKPVVEDRTA